MLLVVSVPVSPLDTPRPILAFVAMAIVLDANCVQVVPLLE
jgi:hypothetical protein